MLNCQKEWSSNREEEIVTEKLGNGKCLEWIHKILVIRAREIHVLIQNTFDSN